MPERLRCPRCLMGFRLEKGRYAQRTRCVDCGQRWWHRRQIQPTQVVVVGIDLEDRPEGWYDA